MGKQSNITEVQFAFREAILDAGIVPPDGISADGEIHRWHVSGDGAGSKNGWYVLHADGIPAGAFGDWKRNFDQTWSARSGAHLSRAERTARSNSMRQIKQKRTEELKRRSNEAREMADKIWDAAGAVPNEFPYLQSKGIKSYGLRFDGDALMVPMRDKDGTLWSIQRIYEDGRKRNLAGGAKVWLLPRNWCSKEKDFCFGKLLNGCKYS